MILPDVHVLVYAADEQVAEHATYAAWLNHTLETDELLLPDAVLTGFLRVVTNAGVRRPPVSMPSALEFVAALRARRSVRAVEGSRAVWARFVELCAGDMHIRGKLVPDAHLAAIALSHAARLATRDRGFARYPGLRWFDPAKEAEKEVRR